MGRPGSGGMWFCIVACVLGCGWIFPAVVFCQRPPAQPPVSIPSGAEVQDILEREPMTLANWPIWRARLLSWINSRNRDLDPAFNAARQLMRQQLSPQGKLPAALNEDFLAWYLTGSGLLYDANEPGAAGPAQIKQAETCFRESLRLNPQFPHAHRNLGTVLEILSNLVF